MTLAIGIAHAAWDVRRHESLARLLGQLPEGVYVQSSQFPESSWGYARSLLQWAAKQDAPCVLLNDDITVCPDFARAVEGMIAAAPGEVLGLHAQGEAARALCESGGNWCREYNLTGPGNVMLPIQARALLDFWNSTPELQCVANVAEDNVGSLWMFHLQRPAWLPLPSPVKHDPTLPSCIGNDKHKMRSTMCAWDHFNVDMADPATWQVSRPHVVPWLENPWFPVAQMHRIRRALLFGEDTGICVVCDGNPQLVRSAEGKGVCGPCLGTLTGHVLQQARGAILR